MKVKYVGAFPGKYFNPYASEVVSVAPGDVIVVSDEFGALLVKESRAQFVVTEPPTKTVKGPGGSVRVDD